MKAARAATRESQPRPLETSRSPFWRTAPGKTVRAKRSSRASCATYRIASRESSAPKYSMVESVFFCSVIHATDSTITGCSARKSQLPGRAPGNFQPAYDRIQEHDRDHVPEKSRKMISESRIAPQLVLNPTRRVQERVVLLCGARFEPNPIQPVNGLQFGSRDICIIVPKLRARSAQEQIDDQRSQQNESEREEISSDGGSDINGALISLPRPRFFLCRGNWNNTPPGNDHLVR